MENEQNKKWYLLYVDSMEPGKDSVTLTISKKNLMSKDTCLAILSGFKS